MVFVVGGRKFTSLKLGILWGFFFLILGPNLWDLFCEWILNFDGTENPERPRVKAFLGVRIWDPEIHPNPGAHPRHGEMKPKLGKKFLNDGIKGMIFRFSVVSSWIWNAQKRAWIYSKIYPKALSRQTLVPTAPVAIRGRILAESQIYFPSLPVSSRAEGHNQQFSELIKRPKARQSADPGGESSAGFLSSK